MAGGRAGVDRAIAILSSEIVRTMALLGVQSVDELEPCARQPLARLTAWGEPRPGFVGDNRDVVTPYVQQSSAASLVLGVSVGAFVVGEVSQVWRVRRGATRADLGAEVASGRCSSRGS